MGRDQRGGTRTTFRVNCLFGAALRCRPSETLQEAATLWQSTRRASSLIVGCNRRGREGFNNLRHPCCSQNLMRSSYNLSTLLSLEAKGARFASSALCTRPTRASKHILPARVATRCTRHCLYASAWTSMARALAAGATADKVYAHAYDERVGLCLEPGSRVYEFSNTKGLNGFFKWRRDRVRGELMMHLMHAVGIVRWVQ